MTHKLACADFTFPLLTHEQSLQTVAMLGFQGVDIGLFEGRSHLWPSKEFTDVQGSAAELKKKTDDLGLQVADVFLQTAEEFVSYAINHPEAERRGKARDWFLESLEYAAACGCRHVTVLPGVEFKDEESHDQSYARSLEELAWRVDQATKCDIIFGVEAHVGCIVHAPDAVESLVKAVPGLTLTLDYTHFTSLGMPDSTVEPLVQYASHFHVRGARKNRLQASFDDNIVDYGRVYETMKATSYIGWIGIEYVWIDWEHCNECDNLSETVQFRDFMQSLMVSRLA